MSILQFNNEPKESKAPVQSATVAVPQGVQTPVYAQDTVKLLDIPVPSTHFYDKGYCPPELENMLLPDGSEFGLFSDPYGEMVYLNTNVNTSKGYFWLENRIEDNTFTEREIQMFHFFAQQRCATRDQIKKILFNDEANPSTISKFINKNIQRGILATFTWKTPLYTERHKPRVYGLTKVGVKAANLLFHYDLPLSFQFQPVNFKSGTGPNMSTFFLDLVANQLFSELSRIDRVLSWQRRPAIRLVDGNIHYPMAQFQVIRDENEFRTFWLEVIRPGFGWMEKTKARMQKTAEAYEKLPVNQRPARLIIVVDGDSRIPYIAQWASQLMPDVKLWFTTDERLLAPIGHDTFLIYDEDRLKRVEVGFLQEGWPGMTASEYRSRQELLVEDDEEYDYIEEGLL